MKDKQLIIDGEKVFLKRRATGWVQIFPFKVDGKWNTKNILLGGSWAHVRKIALIVALILLASFFYYIDSQEFRNLEENPCDYIEVVALKCMATQDDGWFPSDINFEEVKLDG